MGRESRRERRAARRVDRPVERFGSRSALMPLADILSDGRPGRTRMSVRAADIPGARPRPRWRTTNWEGAPWTGWRGRRRSGRAWSAGCSSCSRWRSCRRSPGCPPRHGVAVMQAINVTIVRAPFMLVFVGTALACVAQVVLAPTDVVGVGRGGALRAGRVRRDGGLQRAAQQPAGEPSTPPPRTASGRLRPPLDALEPRPHAACIGAATALPGVVNEVVRLNRFTDNS